MLKSRLTPYILVSILIHTGLLLGIHSFLKLPDAELEPQVLIPVEIVVTRKPSPDSVLKLAASEPAETMIKDLLSRSRQSTDIEAAQPVDDLSDPLPAEVDYQPMVNQVAVDTSQATPVAGERQMPPGQAEIELGRIPLLHLSPADEQISEADPVAEEIDGKPLLAVDERPTPSPTTPTTPKEKLVTSEPVSLAIQMNALHLFPAEPSSPVGSTPLDIKPAGDLVEAKIAAGAQVSQMAKKARSESVTIASQVSPLNLSPVAALPPSGSAPMDISTSANLVEAKTAVGPQVSQATQMALISPVDIGTGDKIVSDLRPLPMEAENEPQLMASTLQIDSQPKGAQVYVNGRLIGETPLVWELPLGKYEVRLALPDYHGWDSQINLIESNLAYPVVIRLLPVE